MKRIFLTAWLLLLIGAAIAQSPTRTVRIDDDSDWWSATRVPESAKAVERLWKNAQPIRTPDSSLMIADVSLQDRNLENTIVQKFGPVTEISRGDASTGRRQYCYKSAGSNVHLIFEFGEVNSAFYLFSDRDDWSGSEACAVSKKVDEKIHTPSGLQLGVSRAEVERILGKPSSIEHGRIVYARSVSLKTSVADIKQARARNPRMSEKEIQENYGRYDMSAYLEARFKGGRLSYLVVSESETF